MILNTLYYRSLYILYSIHEKLQYFFFKANPCRSTPCIFQVAHSSPRIPFGSAAAAGWWCPIDKGTTWLGHNSFWRSGRRKSSYFACRVSAFAQKNSNFFFRICSACSTLHLRITSNFSPSVYYYIYTSLRSYSHAPPWHFYACGVDKKHTLATRGADSGYVTI